MYTVDVTPIGRGSAVEELRYFSAREYPPGSLVHVPLRGAQVQALVLACEPARETKAAVRASAFTLRKIRAQQPSRFLTSAFIRAAHRAAAYHAAATGALLYGFLPKVLTDHAATYTAVPEQAPVTTHGTPLPRLYQGPTANRVDFFRTTTRETFAARRSVLIVAPTVADAERLYDALAPGIERYTHLLHGSVPPKAARAMLPKILEEPHPVLIVATAAFLSIPRADIATIIVEREGSPHHRQPVRPHADARVLAQYLAEELGAQLYRADLPLRIESVRLRELGACEEVASGNQRMQFESTATLISRQDEKREPRQPFHTVGSKLLERVQRTVVSGGRVFLYTARRGLAPTTVCGDCGATVLCAVCHAAVVLHRGDEENFFLCHSCGAMRHARERCATCQSWRLETLGVGIELVEREVRTTLPDTPCFVLSRDTATTHRAARTQVASWYETPGSVLLGTDLALPYLLREVPLVGVVSLDTLLSLSNWNVYERVATTLTRLRETARDELVLQTRHPEYEVLSHILAGNFSGYYQAELRARKTFGYPPFTTIIKVSVAGTEERVAELMEHARTVLAPYELVTFPRTFTTPRGARALHGFLRVPRESWPDPHILARLRSLSPRYVIAVDPDSIV